MSTPRDRGGIADAIRYYWGGEVRAMGYAVACQIR